MRKEFHYAFVSHSKQQNSAKKHKQPCIFFHTHSYTYYEVTSYIERVMQMALTRRNQNLNRVLKHFAFMWVLTVVGLFIATLLPSAIVMPLSIICIVLLIIACFVRSVKLANSIMYTIPLLMGILLFWTTQFFIGELGKELVLLVFGASRFDFHHTGTHWHNDACGHFQLGKLFIYHADCGHCIFTDLYVRASK